MRVLVDMNLSPKWAGFLESAGIFARHWSTIGATNAPDSELMRHAATNDYIILTHDLDFGSILAASGGVSPSVVQIRADDLSFAAIGDKVVAALRQMASELADGALITVDARRARLTLLPIPQS